jgi:hypothetical protein
MYEKVFESTKLAQPAQGGDSWYYLYYVSTWDACLAQSIWEWSRVFRDGTKVKFGTTSGGYALLGRVKGFPAFWNQWTGKVHPAFEINGLPNPNEVLNPDWDIGYGLGPSTQVGKFIDDMNQVYLHQPNASRIDIYSLEKGLKVGEIVHNAGEYFASLAWVQPGQVAGLCLTSGKVRIMDYLSSPRVLESGRIEPFKVAAYDSAFHLFFAIGTDHKARVYCREAWPAGLSAPVFEPATVCGLKANRVKTRLTGQDGEPCPDWWVHWELLGVGGNSPMGYLDNLVSKTDKEGWARNLFFGPDDGSTGQSRIRARVVLY